MIERRRFLLALAGMVAAPALRAQGTGMAPIAALPPAPALRLPNDDDRPVDLAQYRGTVVLVNFWATWCPPCRREFPSLTRIRRLFKAAPFEVVAVNVGEEPDAVFSFAGNTDFPVLFDRDAKAMAAWSVLGLPTTFLVDRQGRLAYRATGGREFDAPEIVALVKGLLK